VTNFYIVSAGMGATLVGLLFVAVQIGPPITVSGGVSRRHAMARSTFAIFIILVALSMYLLLPFNSIRERALVAMAGAAFGIVRAVRTWTPVWADKFQGRSQFRLWQTAWLLLGPVIAYAFIILAAVEQLYTADRNALDIGIAPWFIVLFVIAIRNSWNLLVEGNQVSAAPAGKALGLEFGGNDAGRRFSQEKPANASEEEPESRR
jgi:hypothetical protein